MLNLLSKEVFDFSTRSDGNLSFRYGEQETVSQNRAGFFDRLAIEPDRVFGVGLTHGTDVYTVTPDDLGTGVLTPPTQNYDTLVTNLPNSYLFMVVADCMGIAYHWQQVCALSHVGYDGLNAGLPGLVVRHLVDTYGAKPAEIKVSFSPYLADASCIHEDLRKLTNSERDWPRYVEESDNPAHPYRILWSKNCHDQLREAGIRAGMINDPRVDTYTNKSFFSHTRTARIGDYEEGRFGVIAGIR